MSKPNEPNDRERFLSMQGVPLAYALHAYREELLKPLEELAKEWASNDSDRGYYSNFGDQLLELIAKLRSP